MMSWFNPLTFTDEEIKTQREEITFPRSWYWRGAKWTCEPRLLDLNPVWFPPPACLPCTHGSPNFLMHTAVKPVPVGDARPDCPPQIQPFVDRSHFVQVLQVHSASCLPPSRLLGHHGIIFLQILLIFIPTTRLHRMLASNVTRVAQGVWGGDQGVRGCSAEPPRGGEISRDSGGWGVRRFVCSFNNKYLLYFEQVREIVIWAGEWLNVLFCRFRWS